MSTWMILRWATEPAWSGASSMSGHRFVVVLLRALGHDLERPIRKRALQSLGFIPRCAHPRVALFGRGEDHRHRLLMHAADFGVRLARKERKDVGGDFS